ncbi:hypothetical protein [Bacillus paramycoides]|uniref:hypothetical protein n=1 Tax=Bacillus paramycoides TaxID=2026194 RepID=UPI003D04193B
MTTLYGQSKFTLAAGESVTIASYINGSFEKGGDYVGPMVVAAIPVTLLNIDLDVSTNRVQFKSHGDLTSPCIYWFSYQNNNSVPVTFRVDKFYN